MVGIKHVADLSREQLEDIVVSLKLAVLDYEVNVNELVKLVAELLIKHELIKDI